MMKTTLDRFDDQTVANRLYRAEDQTARRMPPQNKMSLDEVVGFVQRVTSSKWWRRRSKFLQIQIRDGRGSDCALADLSRGIINMPRWSRTKPIVLHELAHLVTNNKKPWHGPEFAANLRDMYCLFLGERWTMILEDRFDNNRIEWTALGYRDRFNIVRPTTSVPRARKPLLVTYE